MRKIIILFISSVCFLLCACTSVGAGSGKYTGNYQAGVSLSLFGNNVTEQNLNSIKSAGIEWIEVVLNPFYRNCPEGERYPRIAELKKLIDASGLKVWSCHLPFSKDLDISLCDDEKRGKALRTQEEMIGYAALFKPERIILHPSSEPIDDKERTERLRHAGNSIGWLFQKVKPTGAVLCVEDLPRTCLGRNSEELLYLIKPYPEVMVCFDSNHLLNETHASFFKKIKDRIGSIHASDYDRVDERHWLEGKGVIDWPAFLNGLRNSGYDGVFMHEVRSGEDVSPESIMKAYNTVVCGN